VIDIFQTNSLKELDPLSWLVYVASVDVSEISRSVERSEWAGLLILLGIGSLHRQGH
jgi:NO-binding membrane sensor protein with MHYT domain